MNSREALRAASASKTFGGRPIRTESGPLVLIAIALAEIVVHFVLERFVTADPIFAMSGGIVFLAVSLRVMYSIATKTVQKHNLAVLEFERQRFDDARRVFVDIATGFAFRSVTAMALHNLAAIAVADSDFDEACLLARASLSLTDDETDASDLARQQLAFALACAGQLRESEAIVARVDLARAGAIVKARIELTRSLIAYRDGRFEEAVTILRASRTLLRNVLNGMSAAMMDAIEAGAVARIAGGYRGGAAAPSGLTYGVKARAAIAKVIPGAEASLVSR